jgi:enterobactin synthetase component D
LVAALLWKLTATPWCACARFAAVTMIHDVPCSPAVLPAAARQVSCRLDGPAGLEPWRALELPSDLLGAVPKRQMQFRAGRFCAQQALAALGCALDCAVLPRTASGMPRWPAGVTGSITHTDEFASAAVACTRDARSLGIDSERVMASARADNVRSHIAQRSELAHAADAGFDDLESLTLVFSAKEALFKRLFPLVGMRFGFHDARLIGIDPRRQSYLVELVRELSAQFPAGTILDGRFEVGESMIHTGMLLSAAATQDSARRNLPRALGVALTT